MNVPITTTVTPAHYRIHCDWHSWDYVREDYDVVALVIPSRVGGSTAVQRTRITHGGLY